METAVLRSPRPAHLRSSRAPDPELPEQHQPVDEPRGQVSARRCPVKKQGRVFDSGHDAVVLAPLRALRYTDDR